MKGRKPRATQFDPTGTMRDRPFERAMLVHRGLHHVINCLGLMGLTAMVWPRFVAPFRWRMTRYDMPFEGLPRELEGYRILQVSDLHIGRTRLSYAMRVAEACTAERPDLIVVTGDLIHYSKEGLAGIGRLLERLKAPDGVVAIFGNHDYHEYSWRHTGQRSAHRAIHKRLVNAVEAAGVRLLRNQMVEVRRGSGVLKIVGLDELWADRFSPEAAFAEVREGDCCLVLQHNPDGAELLLDRPWQWMLCGHSHGGQVDVPVIGPLYVPQEHRGWLRGVFELRPGKRMFVSCGVGYSAPVRMRVRPEVTVFTLRAGSGAEG